MTEWYDVTHTESAGLGGTSVLRMNPLAVMGSLSFQTPQLSTFYLWSLMCLFKCDDTSAKCW